MASRTLTVRQIGEHIWTVEGPEIREGARVYGDFRDEQEVRAFVLDHIEAYRERLT